MAQPAFEALAPFPAVRIFTDKLSGKNTDRPELTECLKYLRGGDTLVVPSLDRLARSLPDLITLTVDLRKRGIGFKSLHESLDTTTPGGRLVFHVFAALAEFIRELIILMQLATPITRSPDRNQLSSYAGVPLALAADNATVPFRLRRPGAPLAAEETGMQAA